MLDYSIIKNQQLRELVMLSESLNSLAEDKLLAMIKQIADLPEAGQIAMIETLEAEQAQIQAAKLAKGITPEMERKELEEKALKIKAIKYDFEKTVRGENEKKEALKANSTAENLLKNI